MSETESLHTPTPLHTVLKPVLWVLLMVVVSGCSTTKYVPEGDYLLDKVNVRVDGADDVSTTELKTYLRQMPNHQILGFLKLQLHTYSLSGRDSTKWYNKWVRRMGHPPVILDSNLTRASAAQLRLAMINRGYMDAQVNAVTTAEPGSKKARVDYHITAGEPHRIASVGYEIPDSAINAIVMADSLRTTVSPGELLDRNLLDSERTRLTELLRNRGYYAFTKEQITFIVDTVRGSKEVDLTMVFNPGDVVSAANSVHIVRRVIFVTDYSVGTTLQDALAAARDTVAYRDCLFLYGKDRWITPGTLENKCFIRPGAPFHAASVDRTYEYLMQLGIIKSVNIEIQPVGTIDDVRMLDAYILISANKSQSLTFELEGTNSEGDLGIGAGVTWTHRNVAHRARQLTVKGRAAYESLSGNLEGLIIDNFQEYAAEVGLNFPRFAMPFISGNFRKRVKASTEVALSFNYQARPEYTRIIAGATWRYKWSDRFYRSRRVLDLLNINYVHLPRTTIDFLDQIAPNNPLLRYSYEDHFISNIGYSIYQTNRAVQTAGSLRPRFQERIYSLRASVEAAGNLLYGIVKAIGKKRQDGVYKVFDTQFSQYVKAEAAYSLIRNFTPRHSLAFNVALGVGVPYGNSEMMPFEKRFYAGGANGVRGWSVRSLGPGRFDSRNNVTDFINQCGDISFLTTLEYRAKLFWVLEAGVFVDAGNIWTIRNYESQPGGVFRFNSFYKELAASYGVGLRFDFTFFLLRLDLGMKAVNPAMGQEQWPIIHPQWRRDATFHFAVGYPF